VAHSNPSTAFPENSEYSEYTEEESFNFGFAETDLRYHLLVYARTPIAHVGDGRLRDSRSLRQAMA